MKNTINSIRTNIVLMALLLSGMDGMAQDADIGLTPDKLLPQFINLTPEAASLGRYGAFQVSEYSGTADISVPLYTVKSGDVSFPITLYYDASGIKVEQDATFVGLGWNLSYGGMISHVFCGKDDFSETTGYTNYYQNYWEEKNTSVPDDLPCQSLEDISIATVVSGLAWGPLHEDKFSLYDRMSKGYDNPDVFQANFCGHHVSFILDKRTGKDATGLYPVIVLNDDSRKYRISYEMELTLCGNQHPSSFTIVDDKGTTFIFSAYSENVFSYEHVDSYYLTKIYGPDGVNGKSVVSIEYVQSTIYFGSQSRPRTKGHQSNARRIWSNSDIMPALNDPTFEGQYNWLVGNINESYYQEIGCNDNGISRKVYPLRIIAALDTIEFERSAREDLYGAMSISGITIKSKYDNAQKTISFTYGYFNEEPPHSDYSRKRLKLTGVTIDDKKYTFAYDNHNLPAFTSYSKDYWGYYNGANPTDDRLIACTPAYSISNGLVEPEEHLDGSNRLASEELCNVGMLKRITYPTGGYTDYEYEIHRFNDKYYYPDASDTISFPPAFITMNESVNLYGTMTRTMAVTIDQESCDLVINGRLYGTSDTLTVTVKDSSGTAVRTLYYLGSNYISATEPLSLIQNATYTIEAVLSAASSSGSNTYASCSFRYSVPNTNITASPTTNNENGGYSIGGGLRIKTVKNYDSDSTYLNGVEYKYSGGKLLNPTVLLEKHFVDLFWYYSPPYSQNYILNADFSFYYANTEPSFLYICSLGVPGTVGYDRVVKNEIDESGNILRKTVLDFHNYGYITDDANMNAINARMQNSFYFNSYYNNFADYPKGHLNGKIKKETILSETGDTSYVANYTYSCVRQGSVLYPKCFPKFLPGLRYVVGKFDLAFFRKIIAWSFLTSKSETYYNSSGSALTSHTTTYSYNSTNYQPSEMTINDGLNTARTCFWYPSDGKVAGYSYLTSKNNISEVTATDTYRNNVYTAGSRYNYTLVNNLPVVNSCLSLHPDSSAVLQMQVTDYDCMGNIREYHKKDGTPVTIIWSYSHQYPVMEIVGKTYAQIYSVASSVSQLENMLSPSYSTVKSVYNSIRQGLPDALVTAYLYAPWHNVSRIIQPNGYEVSYGYDSYGRLTDATDASGVLQRYIYNYKNR